MNLIKTNNEKRSKPLLGVFAVGLALSLVLGLAVVRSYSVGSGPQNTTQNGDINVTNNYSGQLEDSGDFKAGAISNAASTPNHLDAGEWTQWNDGHFDDVELEDDLWVNGDLNVTGTVNSVVGLNLSSTSFNSNSTTLCSVVNNSGTDRILSAGTILITSTTGEGATTQWRAYVSAGRAANNTAGSSTIFRQIELPAVTSANAPLAYGGPVPGSYYVTSSVNQTAVPGLASSTLVLWRNGWYANVTSTAITSSTGKCFFPWYAI